jgi:hypothetical protein
MPLLSNRSHKDIPVVSDWRYNQSFLPHWTAYFV